MGYDPDDVEQGEEPDWKYYPVDEEQFEFCGGIVGIGTNIGEFTSVGRKWPKGIITYQWQEYHPKLVVPDQREAFEVALRAWSDVADLTFEEVPRSHEADIRVRFTEGVHGDGYPFDGPGRVLAHAFFPQGGREGLPGDIHFDVSEAWTVGSMDPIVDLIHIAIHELGHALGLGHSDKGGAIMYPIYVAGRTFTRLHDDDDEGITSLYGAATSEPSPAPDPEPVPDQPTDDDPRTPDPSPDPTPEPEEPDDEDVDYNPHRDQNTTSHVFYQDGIMGEAGKYVDAIIEESPGRFVAVEREFITPQGLFIMELHEKVIGTDVVRFALEGRVETPVYKINPRPDLNPNVDEVNLLTEQAGSPEPPAPPVPAPTPPPEPDNPVVKRLIRDLGEVMDRYR